MAEPRTDWKESVGPGESERFEGYARFVEEMQRKSAGAGKPGRALHRKQLVGARAQLTVLPDLPAHARIGLFAQPRSYDAWVRFSNGVPHVQDDRKADIRGLAIKVLGVPGKKVIPGLEDAQTQDFSMIQSPVIPFRNADEFMYFLTIAGSPALILPRFLGHFGLARTLSIVKIQTSRFGKVSSLAGLRFWTPVPIKFGPYAVRYSAKPVNPPAPAPKAGSPNFLGELLADALVQRPVAFDFMLQFYCDPQKTPIEDASVDWREEDAPFVTVARLTLLQQDTRSERGEKDAALVEAMSFNPWHALAELRPLGSIMRARSPAYRLSTAQRSAVPEPASPNLPA